MKIYFTYIIQTAHDKHFVGVTSNLMNRLLQHKEEELEAMCVDNEGGSKLVWYDYYDNLGEAIEKRDMIKKWSNQEKRNFLNQMDSRLKEES